MISAPPTRLQIALRLGRVSNLPTVWTNVMAGLALNGGPASPPIVIGLGCALSALYVGGMFLNDAFDAKWDSENRAERPIPMGLVRARTVFVGGFALIGVGLALLVFGTQTLEVIAAGVALAGLIVLYDVSHKRNPAAPVIMGLCRVGVYVVAAFTTNPVLHAPVFWGAGVLLAYLIFLSTLARKETLFPRLPPMIGALIAGISLLDAGILALTGHFAAALVACLAFGLTRSWQRSVPGT